MIHLVLDVWDSTGATSIVHCYLLDAMPHLVRHFAYAAGLGHRYEAGELSAEDCQGKSGRCKIRNEQDRAKAYPPKNAIADFVVADTTKAGDGYQQAKTEHAKPAANTPDAGAVALKTAKRRAWEAWQRSQAKETPGTTESDMVTTLEAVIANVFPGHTSKTLTVLQWVKLVDNGFRKKETTNSIPSEPSFQDSDIPF
jgi:hypothetical protein